MVAKQLGSDIFYYIKDALGSTREVWQHGGGCVFTVLTYKPFGEPVGVEGAERFEYAGEMIVGAAGSSPAFLGGKLQAKIPAGAPKSLRCSSSRHPFIGAPTAKHP